MDLSIARMTMTSFYIEVDRWGRRDKKAEAKVVELAASPVTPRNIY